MTAASGMNLALLPAGPWKEAALLVAGPLTVAVIGNAGQAAMPLPLIDASRGWLLRNRIREALDGQPIG
jgi:hypothetical protein